MVESCWVFLSYGFEAEIVLVPGRESDLRGHSLIVLVTVPREVGTVYCILYCK